LVFCNVKIQHRESEDEIDKLTPVMDEGTPGLDEGMITNSVSTIVTNQVFRKLFTIVLMELLINVDLTN